jgi:hypothetical protein
MEENGLAIGWLKVNPTKNRKLPYADTQWNVFEDAKPNEEDRVEK